MKLHYGCKDINNFGDIVPAYVYRRMGISVEWASADEAEILAGGSILSDARSNNTVLCCGFSSADQECEQAKILSVRGPLTRNRLLELDIECPEVYQDMVDFLPALFYPKVKKKYGIGILPHYVDYDDMVEKYKDSDIPVIDICSGVESVVIQMLQCEHIHTSSLHGIIAAHTYGINWLWFKNNELASPDFKFQDYFARIGLTGIQPIQE